MSIFSLWFVLADVWAALLGNIAAMISTAEVVDAADLPSFNLPGSGGPFGWPDIPGIPPPFIPGPGPDDGDGDDDDGGGGPGIPGWPPTDGSPPEDPEPPEPPEECEQ